MFERRLYFHIDWLLLGAVLLLAGIGLVCAHAGGQLPAAHILVPDAQTPPPTMAFAISRLTDSGYAASLTGLKWAHAPLLLGLLLLAAGEILLRRWRMLQQTEFQDLYRTLQMRQRRILESTLRVLCELVARTLDVPCNARYFVAEQDLAGRYYLRQDRDLAVLTIAMPREFGFTRVYVDTPRFVSGRAFRDRVPLYEELPVDHSSWYETDVARMIEPQQRWVLACPVLRLDVATNSHQPDPPHGVVVFYGTEVPGGDDAPVRVGAALDYSQHLAEQMSHVFNMLDLSADVEASDDTGS
jgi:hypothetical protein